MIEPDMPRRVQSGMRLTRGRILAITALLGITALSAAAIVRAADDAASAQGPSDPWEHFNRKNYAIQQGLERAAIRPMVKFYRALTPGPIGIGIHNVLVNLSEPVVLINDILQFRIKRAAVPVARMVLNTTLGLLGLFDVAARMGLPHHGNEFGVTLGRFGVKSGPYLYVPLIGPSSPRDLFGSVVDFVANPLQLLRYPNRTRILETQFLVGGLDLQISTKSQLNALLSGAVDPYATLRSAFIQNKQGEINGSGVPLNLPTFDDTDTPPPRPPALEPDPPPDPTAATH
jgi:phospholipid-binding lipoprotein MlaA